MRAQRAVQLYFREKDFGLVMEIEQYALETQLSFSKAVWELVRKGLKAKGLLPGD